MFSQVEVQSLDAGFFTARGTCEECGVSFASGGDSALAADSGTRMQLRRHAAEEHGAVEGEEGDLELTEG